MLITENCVGTIAGMYADTLRGKFHQSFSRMLLYTQKKLCKNPEDFLNVEFGQCSYHQLGRNTLAEQIQGPWLMYFDSDHMFQSDIVLRLLSLAEKNNAKVISGIYQTKFPPHNPVACVWTSDGNKAYPIQDWNREKEVLQLDGAVGGGCLLIFKEVFERIKNELNESPFTEYNGLSEDYSFCHRCKRLGIPIYLAPRVESHHLVDHALSIEDYIPPPKETLRGI